MKFISEKGILVGFENTKRMGQKLTEYCWSLPRGVVVPGYIALFLDQPIRILVTLPVALLTYFSVKMLSNYIIIYGRHRFLAI